MPHGKHHFRSVWLLRENKSEKQISFNIEEHTCKEKMTTAWDATVVTCRSGPGFLFKFLESSI